MVLRRTNHVQSGFDAEQDLYGVPILSHLCYFLQEIPDSLPRFEWLHHRIRNGFHHWDYLPMHAYFILLGPTYSRWRTML